MNTVQSKSKREAEEQKIPFLKRPFVDNLIRILLFAVITVACLYALMTPSNVERYHAGQTAPRTVNADFSFSWVNTQATRRLKAEAVKGLPQYYSISQDADTALETLMKQFMEEARRKQDLTSKSVKYYSRNPGSGISRILEKLKDSELKVLAQTPVNLSVLLQKILARGVISEQIRNELKFGTRIAVMDSLRRIREPVPLDDILTPEKAFAGIFTELLQYSHVQSRSQLISMLAGSFAKLWPSGNLVENPEVTRQESEKLQSVVQPVRESVRAGEAIFLRGNEITAESLEKYTVYLKQQQQKEWTWSMITANLIRIVMILFVVLLCLWCTRKDLLANTAQLALLTVINAFCVFLNTYAISVYAVYLFGMFDIPSQVIYFILPTGIAVILTSGFFGMRIALFSGFFITVVTAMHMPDQLKMILAGFFITACVAASVRNAKNYKVFFNRSFLGCAGGALAAALCTHLHDSSLYPELWTKMAFFSRTNIINLLCTLLLPVAAGLIMAIVSLLLLFLIETLFDVYTSMSLQLYSDFNHPLLRLLQEKAPGSYQHSLMVSSIAEKAAGEIGADSLKARVCGLYHDIGKMKQPEFFIENNVSENLHEHQKPEMSAFIILNHVKYGLELAHRYKLKKPLRDGIGQHHGNGLVVFFYRLAEAKAKLLNQSLNADDFRYSGPCPESKEISILMLADCCEAASRSLNPFTRQTLEMKVNEIISQKIRDHQLDSSCLTLHEISVVRSSIINTLMSMSHKRIAYPKEEQKQPDENDLFVAAGVPDFSQTPAEKI